MRADIEHVLHPVAADDPSGPNLEYEPEFQALEELARPRRERALGAGVIVPEAPEWRHVADRTEQLLLRSKDLRIGVLLGTARLHLTGVPGLADGISLLRHLLEHHWDDVHPRLDADDDDDPTERINAITALGDSERTLAHLRNARLFKGVHPGHFSLRELRIVQGVIKPDADEIAGAPDPAAIDACLRECPLDALQTLDAALAAALQDIAAITRTFAERTPARGPDLDALSRDLTELQAFLQPYVSERSMLPAGTADAVPDAGGATVAPARPEAHPFERPDDIRRVLDQLCDYYARREPSSPVPLLLRRAQRLVGLDFAALLRDLAPAGIDELRVVSGEDHSG